MSFTHSTILRKSKIENRRQIRYPGASAVIRASWIDIAGSLRMGQAKLVDICERGLAMELPEKPQPNTFVRFQCDKMKLYGTGAVRHCQSKGSRFVVGLEFSDGIRWQPASQPAEVKDAVYSDQYNFTRNDEFTWNWLFDMPADPRIGTQSMQNA